MNNIQTRREIYKQAKRLQTEYKLPLDSNVYVHWSNNSPVVLPHLSNGVGMATTIKLEKILSKQCVLI
jgi:hypothetical protein